MPIYVYERVDGSKFEDLAPVSAPELSFCPTTGQKCRRVVAPALLRLAPWLRRENEDMNARQRAYMERPDVQAKLRSGELVIDSSDPYADNLDGDAGSSAICKEQTWGGLNQREIDAMTDHANELLGGDLDRVFAE